MTLKDIKHSIAVPYSFRFFRESYMFMQMILRACDSQSSTLKVNSQVACVASVSNRVIARKLERKPSFIFFLLSFQLSRRTSRGNACYAG